MRKKKESVLYLNNIKKRNILENNLAALVKITQLQDEIQVMNDLMELKDKYINRLENDLYRVASGVTFDL